MNLFNRRSPTDEIPSDLSIVGFLGCDGVGTTTHAEHAEEYLNSKGLNTQMMWMRFDNRLSLPILALGRVLGKTSKYGTGEQTIRAHHFEESELLTHVYKKTFLRDQKAMVRRKFAEIPENTDVLICDRFILDGLVNLIVSTKDKSLLDSWVSEGVWDLIPPQSVIIGLNCDPDIIAKRRPDVASDPFLDVRTEVYRSLFQNKRIEVVETSKPIEEAKENVVSILDRQYGIS